MQVKEEFEFSETAVRIRKISEDSFIWLPSKNTFILSDYLQYYTNEGKIIPAKPEILSARELLQMYFNNYTNEAFAKKCDKNGQRRLYYEGGLHKLVEAITDYRTYGTAENLEKVYACLENIKKPE